MGASAQNGNIETALFAQYDRATDFNQLFNQNFLNIRSIDSLDELTSAPVAIWTNKEARPSLEIISAKYERPHLLIDFTYREGEITDLHNFQVVYLLQGKDKRIPVSLKPDSPGHISLDCDLLDTSTIIWLETQRISDGKEIKSDRQWILFPQVSGFSETGFNQDDFDRCAEIGGIEGVREALRLAFSDEQPDWLIAFLQAWNLGEILESTKEPAAKILPANLTGRGPSSQMEIKQEYLRRGLDILVRPDLEEVLQALLENYRKGIEEWIGQAEAESVRMGLQYILVFDLLCLLLMKEFQKLIEIELENKKIGLVYPLMQYGHIREMAHRFVTNFLADWSTFLEKGNLALYSLNDKRLPPNMYLFHNARSVSTYILANRIVNQLDLETSVVFKPLPQAITNLIGQHSKEQSGRYLNSSDGNETLKTLILNYDVVFQCSGVALKIDQLRSELEKLLHI